MKFHARYPVSRLVSESYYGQRGSYHGRERAVMLETKKKKRKYKEEEKRK